MSARVARRYARAFIELLQERKSLAQAEPFLKFCELVAGNDELRRLFANVTIAAEDKARVIGALAKKAGEEKLAALPERGAQDRSREYSRPSSLSFGLTLVPIASMTKPSSGSCRPSAVPESCSDSYCRRVRFCGPSSASSKPILAAASSQPASITYRSSRQVERIPTSLLGLSDLS